MVGGECPMNSNDRRGWCACDAQAGSRGAADGCMQDESDLQKRGARAKSDDRLVGIVDGRVAQQQKKRWSGKCGLHWAISKEAQQRNRGRDGDEAHGTDWASRNSGYV